MSDLELTREQATVLLLQKAVLDLLQELNDQARAEAARRLRVSESKVSDEGFGKVRLDKGAGGPRKAKVVDRAKFTEWVIENHSEVGYEPAHTETRLIPGGVVPAYEAAILAKVKKDGGMVDLATGEVEEVPGVELVDVPPVLKVMVDDEVTRPYVEELLSEVGLAPLLQIERGTTDEGE